MAWLWGGGLQRLPLWEDNRGCPSCLTEPVPSGSKIHLLPKAAQHWGEGVRKMWNNLQTLMKEEVESMLQTTDRFPLSLWRRWCLSSLWSTLKQVGVPSLKEADVHEEHLQEQELWPQGTQSGAVWSWRLTPCGKDTCIAWKGPHVG